MESGTFLDDKVKKEFGRFVLVVLHTDGRDDKYRESSIANATLLRERFNTRSIPFYVAMDPTGTKVYWTGGVQEAEDPDDLVAALSKVPKTFKAERK